MNKARIRRGTWRRALSVGGCGCALTLGGVPSAAFATEGDARAAESFHADFEVDPTAYVFGGHSLHVGLGYERWRLDLGNFALDIPSFIESNDGFAASGSGFGLKLQYFPFGEQSTPESLQQSGVVIGVEAAVARFSVVHEQTELMQAQTQVLPGVNAGYRWLLPKDLYVSAWCGLSYALGASDLDFGEQAYEMNAWRVFPAIHLGYALR